MRFVYLGYLIGGAYTSALNAVLRTYYRCRLALLQAEIDAITTDIVEARREEDFEYAEGLLYLYKQLADERFALHERLDAVTPSTTTQKQGNLL